jgi:hypothetical protein
MNTNPTTPTPTPTNVGKIASLPYSLREEINERLEDGEPTETILAWINANPSVQSLLKSKYQNHLISAQNLSNWRQGGYQSWLKQQERVRLAQDWCEQANQIVGSTTTVETLHENLSQHLSTLLVVELATAIFQLLPTLTDPAERCAKISEYLRTLSRVRQQDTQTGRFAIETERRDRERNEEIQSDLAAEERNKLMLHFLKAYPEMRKQENAVRQAADDALMAKINGLKAAERPKPAPQPDESSPIKANQAQSNPIKADSYPANACAAVGRPPLVPSTAWSSPIKAEQDNGQSHAQRSGDRNGVQTPSGQESSIESSVTLVQTPSGPAEILLCNGHAPQTDSHNLEPTINQG